MVCSAPGPKTESDLHEGQEGNTKQADLLNPKGTPQAMDIKHFSEASHLIILFCIRLVGNKTVCVCVCVCTCVCILGAIPSL